MVMVTLRDFAKSRSRIFHHLVHKTGGSIDIDNDNCDVQEAAAAKKKWEVEKAAYAKKGKSAAPVIIVLVFIM